MRRRGGSNSGSRITGILAESSKEKIDEIKRLSGKEERYETSCYIGFIITVKGSVSIPKEGNPPTYAVLENKVFTIKDFDGNIVKEMRLG